MAGITTTSERLPAVAFYDRAKRLMPEKVLKMRVFQLIAITLVALPAISGCAEGSKEKDDQDAIDAHEAELELQREPIAEAYEGAKAKSETDTEPDDIDLTLELLNQGRKGEETAPQAPAVGDLGLGAPPLNNVRTAATDDGAPTGQSQMTDAEKEEFQRELDALAAEAQATLADVRATQKALDREMEEAIRSMFSNGGLSAVADADRSPECVALTNAVIGGKSFQEIYEYLMGRAELGLDWEQRNPLRDCAMKKDGLSILALILDRIENDWIYGTPSPEWVMDALLTAGEFGAGPAGILADLWTINFADKQYMDNGLYWRLNNSSRMSRLRLLAPSIDGWEEDFDQAQADNRELRKMLNDTQNTCWRAQETYRSLPESARADYVKVLRGAAPQQEDACAIVGIEMLDLGPLPHHKVQWAEGLEDLSFRSGDGLVKARDVARLFDNWRKARAKNNWNTRYSSFVHFSSHSKNQYVAGYDPYPHRYGDTMHYGFRVLRVDFGVYRKFMSAYWAPYADPNYKRQHPIPEAREDLKKIILALEPGIHFLMGHYEEEGMWTWLTLEGDLQHPTTYTQSTPFHEYEAMLADMLK